MCPLVRRNGALLVKPGTPGVRLRARRQRWQLRAAPRSFRRPDSPVDSIIRGFGGDPTRVLFYGQSSGANHALWMPVVARFKGLVLVVTAHSACAQPFFNPDCAMYQGLKTAAAPAMELAREHNCTIGDDAAIRPRGCLRAVPWASINPGADRAVIDGTLIRDLPFNLCAHRYRPDRPASRPRLSPLSTHKRFLTNPTTTTGSLWRLCPDPSAHERARCRLNRVAWQSCVDRCRCAAGKADPSIAVMVGHNSGESVEMPDSCLNNPTLSLADAPASFGRAVSEHNRIPLPDWLIPESTALSSPAGNMTQDFVAVLFYLTCIRVTELCLSTLS